MNIVEIENSKPERIIIERVPEGFGRSMQTWNELTIKHWHKKAINTDLDEEDYEKILKILKKYDRTN